MIAVVMPSATARLVAVADKPECVKPLDLYMSGFTEVQVDANFACLGSAGLAIYREVETHDDLFYPMSYAIFFSLGIFLWAGYTTQNKKLTVLLVCLPVLTMAFDYAENASIVTLIDQYPDMILDGNSVQTASFFNQIKWVLAIVSMALFAVFGIWALIKWISVKRVRA